MKRIEWGRGLSLAALVCLIFTAVLGVLVPDGLAGPLGQDPLVLISMIVVCAVWFLAGARWQPSGKLSVIFAVPHRVVFLGLAVFSLLTLLGFLRVTGLNPDTDLKGPTLGVVALLLYSLGHLAYSILRPADQATKSVGSPETAQARGKHREDRVRLGQKHAKHGSKIGKRQITVALAIVLFLAAGAHLLLNGLVLYSTPRLLLSNSFDHGIFAQSMEGIIREGVPVTSLERGRHLSHFAVHFSPVPYLVVPFYALARSQVFLSVFQLVPVFLALWPLGAVMRLRGASTQVTLAVMTLYILSPAQIFSSHYGFHENVFLGLAIFTLWYAWERFNLSPTKPALVGVVLAAAFVLGVKEDAFIYVLAFAMWQIFEAAQRRDRKPFIRAIALALVALAYFATVTTLMAHFGSGTMQVSRFSNFLPEGESGFTAIIWTILVQPGYALAQVFATQKLSYLLIVMAAVAFAPVWSRKYAASWLLLPLMFVNLLPNWVYQYDLTFQYHYGTSALLLIMLIVSLDARSYRRIIAGMLALAVAFCGVYDFQHLYEPAKNARSSIETQSANADQINEALQNLPKDAVYLVDSRMGAAMFRFPNTYLEPAKLLETFQDGGFDYVVMDGRFSLKPETREAVDELIARFNMQRIEVGAPVEIYRVGQP